MPEKRYDRVRLPPIADSAKRQAKPAAPRRRAQAPLVANSPVQRLLQRLGAATVRRKPRIDAFAAPPQVEQSLEQSRGSGQPLPSPARERMESAFGASFEGVTLHTDSGADQLTRQVDAVAFTHGRDIYFSSGSFAPESTGGQKLLAHELTHVVQQRPGRKVTVGAAHDPAESEADQMAEVVVHRLQRQQTRQTLADSAVARQPESEEEALEPLRRQEEEEEAQAVRRQAEGEEEEEEIQLVRRQTEGDAEEELVEPLRRQEEEEEAQTLRRQEGPPEEEELQPLRRQESGEEEEEVQLVRRQPEGDAEEELAQPLRRAPRVTSAAAQASAPATQDPQPITQEGAQQQPPQDVASDGSALYQQGLAAYQAGDMSQALDCFKQVSGSESATEGQRASAIWNIGRIYQDLGDDKGALEMYRAYLAQPNIPDDRRATAQEIVERMERELGPGGGDLEQADSPQAETPPDTEAAAPEETPSDPRARADAVYEQAVQAYRAGELRQALELFQQVLDIDQAIEGRRTNAIWNIGRIHQDLGNNRAALTMYRTFLAQPDVSEERRETAQGIVEDMEREQAGGGVTSETEAPTEAKDVKSPAALPSDPEQRGQALQGLATQAYQSGDYATALEHFQQLMRTNGLEQRVYSQTLFNMAQCYRRMGNAGAAIDMYRGFMAQPDTTDEDRARAQQLIAMLQH